MHIASGQGGGIGGGARGRHGESAPKNKQLVEEKLDTSRKTDSGKVPNAGRAGRLVHTTLHGNIDHGQQTVHAKIWLHHKNMFPREHTKDYSLLSIFGPHPSENAEF